MKTSFFNSMVCGVDVTNAGGQIVGTSLLFVSTAGREAGSSESAFAFGKGAPSISRWGNTSHEEESAEWPFGPRPGQASPTPGANPSFPKKKRPAFAGRRSGDAIPGGVKELKGVFGAGALLPQFLAELTDTINSQICKQIRTLAGFRQALLTEEGGIRQKLEE